jgi:hypothetical protein
MENFCEFELIQHTPLIHFQPLQKGASIRPTELKPKFDRFLRKKLEEKLSKEKLEKLLLKENAFDYKVFIEPILTPPNKIKNSYLFFANMKKTPYYKLKQQKKTNGVLKVKFYSFNSDIIRYIRENFKEFLTNTNFGTRQSKGFGSFYLKDEEFDPSLVHAKKVYSFKVKTFWEKDVALFYKFLRAGINEKGFYIKPLIFLYAKKKRWQWDKKAIKEFFFKDDLETQKEKYKNSDVLWFESEKKYLLRDVFGLSTNQYWKTYGTSITKQSVKKDKKEKPYYSRMKSPITFKIINDMVYFWVNDHYEKILAEEFEIKAKGKRGILKLRFPEKIDLDEVLSEIKSLDLKKMVNNTKHEYFEILNAIIEEIKADL